MSQAVAELREPDTTAPQQVIQSANAENPALKYGSRLRLGMIIPSVNSNAEAHIAAMLPDGAPRSRHVINQLVDNGWASPYVVFNQTVEHQPGRQGAGRCGR